MNEQTTTDGWTETANKAIRRIEDRGPSEDEATDPTEFERGIDAAIRVVRDFKRDFNRGWRDQLTTELLTVKENESNVR